MNQVATPSPNRVLLIVLCFLLPPAAVAAQQGLSFHFWLNLVLTLATFGIAGIVHALIVTLM